MNLLAVLTLTCFTFSVVLSASNSNVTSTTRAPNGKGRRRPPSSNHSQTKLRSWLFNRTRYNSASVPVILDATKMEIEASLILSGLYRVEDAPHQIAVQGMICLGWRDEYLEWLPSIHDGWEEVTARRWEVWSPRLVYYRRELRRNSMRRRNTRVKVDSNGNVKYCLVVQLIAFCGRDDYPQKCNSTVKLVGYPDARVLFKTGSPSITADTGHFNHPDFTLLEVSASAEELYPPSRFTTQGTFTFKVDQHSPLQFYSIQLPMFYVIVAMIASTAMLGQKYEFYSLKTTASIFTALTVMLTVDHTFHPTMANAPYLWWVMGFHATMALISICEVHYPSVKKKYGIPDASFTNFISANIIRFAVSVLVLIFVIII